MTHRQVERRPIRLAAWIVATLLGWSTLISGCGPGVGGTGTGQEPPGSSVSSADTLAAAGARAADLCASELAALLGCAVGGSSALPGAGTPDAVHFADHTSAAHVTVRIQGNQLDLVDACSGWHFHGVWGQREGQAARFYGSATRGGIELAATLEATLVQGQLQVQLRDGLGQLLMETVRLLPTSAPLAASCG